MSTLTRIFNASIRYSSWAIAILVLGSLHADIYAQSPPNETSAATMTGAPPNSTHDLLREDVALASGDVHVYLPILSLPGKGGQTLNLGWAADSHAIVLQELDNSNGWNDPTGQLYPFVYAQWNVSPELGGYITVPHLRASWFFEGDYLDSSHANYAQFCLANFTFRDEYGTTHTFSGSMDGLPLARDCSYTGTTGQQTSHTNPVGDSDESHGMKLDLSNANDLVIWTKDGTSYHFPGVTPWPQGSQASGYTNLISYDNDFVKIVDRNGNTISKSGSVITDSVGRTVTVAVGGVTWTDSNGVQQSVAISTGGSPGPAVTTHASSCQFTNQYQSQYQSAWLYGGDLGQKGNYATEKIISYPGGAQYQVQFDQLGAITKVTYPSGGYTRYDYVTNPAQFNLGGLTCYAADYHQVSAKHVCADSAGSCTSGTEATTTYTPNDAAMDGQNLTTDVVDPYGNRTHYEFRELNPIGPGFGHNPRETLRQVYSGQSTLLKTITTHWTSTDDWALEDTVTTTLNDVSPNLVSKIVTSYDTVSESYLQGGVQRQQQALIDNPTEVDEYDYSGNIAKKTAYTWDKGSGNYTTSTGHILDRPLTITVTDPGSGVSSTTSNTYDAVGNVKTKALSGTGVSAVTTTYGYNSYGDVTSVIDAKSNQMTTAYSGWVFESSPPCAVDTTSTGKPSSVTNALSQITSYKYYACTGLVAWMKDANANVTQYVYDALGRATTITLPDGTGSDISYVDSPPESKTTTVHFNLSPVQDKVTTEVLDGLGHLQTSELTSDPLGETDVDYTYDLMERKSTVSNPHRSTSSTTDGIRTYVYDALSRLCTVGEPDGTVVSQTAGCPTSWPSGDTFNSYLGNCATTTDDAGVVTQRCYDALGRLSQVVEDPASSKFETDYYYTAFGTLYCVQQKGNAGSGWTVCPSVASATNPFTSLANNGYHGRWFVYDGLSRLTDAYNPESGHINWAYDANSNVTSKTDNRGVVTNYNPSTYPIDALNRVQQITYSDSTPSVRFLYDNNFPSGATITAQNGIGRRTGMTDGSGWTAWDYDSMGRAAWEQRNIGSATKKIYRHYNGLNGVDSITYPDATNTVLNYTYNTAGQIARVKDATNGIYYAGSFRSDPQCLVSGGSYGDICHVPTGAVGAVYLGYQTSGGGGFAANTAYNSRLLETSVKANHSSTTLLSLTYGYTNGRVTSFRDANVSTLNKNFFYDPATGRIAQYKSPSGTTWNVQYTIDPWGNLQNKSIVPGYGGESFQGGPVNNANQFTSGFGYDASGNVASYGGATYAYDGESRIKSVTVTSTTTTYKYDGDGQRVQKSSGETYWGGSAGSALMETDNSGTPTAEYIYLDGAMIARRDLMGTPSLKLYLSDELRSTTLITDSSGSPLVRYDYAPYGELHYQSGNDANHYNFTGKERDSETGLDMLGARYYGSSSGRFMTPDWAAKPATVPYANFGSPQSLNLYTYVLNSPTTGGDPDGHCPSADGNCSNVKVEAKVDQKPTVVNNKTIKDINGKVIAKVSGVEGKIVDTVKVNGQPVAGVKVTEANQSSDTKNGQSISTTLVQGKGTTNADGQVGDTLGIYHETDGTKAVNNAIKQDFTNNTWSSTDTQTLTLTLPSGQSCSATSTRTLTNAGPDGSPTSKYTLTTSAPVVTPNN